MTKWWIAAGFSLILGGFLLGAGTASQGEHTWMIVVAGPLLIIGIMLLWGAQQESYDRGYDRGFVKGEEGQGEDEGEEEGDDDPF
jgi:hypothetical protein